MKAVHTVQAPQKSKGLQFSILSAAVTSVCLGLASQHVFAADNQNGEKEIPVVTVYGEKTERTLQETSSSVAVFDDEQIESLNATDAGQLLRLSPNVVDVGNGNAVATVRGLSGSGPGFGAVSFLTGVRPRLNMSVDGRSLTYNELAFGPQSLWDVKQTELYLGPQSYIQGRNAMAGSMVITTNDPTYNFESKVKASGGNQNYRQFAAMISGALIENQLAMRLTAERQQRLSQVDGLATYSPAGDSREIQATTVRAKFLYEPEALPALKTKLTVVNYDTRAPQTENEVSTVPRTRYSANRPVFETNSTSGIWDLDYEINDNLTFNSKTIYTDIDIERLAQTNAATIDGDEFQIEPSLRYQSDDEKVHLLTGLYFFNKDQDEEIDSLGTFRDETTTASAYGELTYALTESVDVTATARYETEDRERKGGNAPRFALAFDESYHTFLPKVSLAWKADSQNTYGVSVARGYQSGGAGVEFTNFTTYQFDPEYVWNYEFFTRHRLAGGKVELTSNLFYNRYDDLQVLDNLVIVNADKASSYGLEAGMNWLINEDIQWFVNLGLMKTKVEEYGSDFDGSELPRAPGFSATSGVRYWFGDFELSGNVRYTDGYYSTLNNDSDGEVDGYSVANLQLAYLFDSGRVTLFANNLFDSDDVIYYGTTNGTTIDKEGPILQQPRLVGVSVSYDF